MDTTPWHARTAAETAAALGLDPTTGLTSAEAARRLAETGPNELVSEPPVSLWRRLLAQFAEPLVLLLLLAIAIATVAWLLEGAAGVPVEPLVILAIVVLNAVLGVVQEARAEQAVAALQRMTEAQATVLRDGREQRIAAREAVPGDLLLLSEGDAIAADARLIDTAALQTAEAALTGESAPILKDAAPLPATTALGDRLNSVFKGTVAASGHGRAAVTATGMATEIGAIAGMLARQQEPPAPLEREIARAGRLLGLLVGVIAVIVVATIVLTNGIRDGGELVDVLLIGVSLAVAAVPEGLPAILSVVLALGVQRMAGRNAIVKQLSAVETLGSASVIGTDKTGTLTRNEMMVTCTVTASGTARLTGTGYAPAGDVQAEGPIREEVVRLLAGAALASNARLEQTAAGWTVLGDPTEGALLAAQRKASADGPPQAERLAENPFTAERKLMSVVVRAGAGAAVYAKGAPDVLMARCSAEWRDGAARPLTEDRRREWLAAIEALAADALRTLAVAWKPLPAGAPPDAPNQEEQLTLLGITGIIDPPRSEAAAAIAEARGAGIRVIMITGDHPRTAAAIATDLGIIPPDGRVLTGADLEGMDGEALRRAATEVSVFARVAPTHKLGLVEALQTGGQVVAMTGDGVNDAPALKRADIGVAMGITGTDVSKEAARLILTDDNFATIVAAVHEGRAIFANIRTFLRYLLSSNAGEVLTVFFGIVLAGVIGLDAGDDGAVAVPFLATHLLWINLITDSLPAIALGVNPPAPGLMARPPRPPGARVIDRPMVTGILAVGLVMAAVTLFTFDLWLPGGLVAGGGTLAEARTAAFTVLVLAQLFNALNARAFTNRLLWAGIALAALLQVAVVHLPPLQHAFGTVPLSAGEWGLCLMLASVVLVAEQARQWVTGSG